MKKDIYIFLKLTEYNGKAWNTHEFVAAFGK